ncbi:SAM-dependent methyltransferase [Rhodoligotrophos appendicifer]|uniref:methyltransferase domain-containing protein n=1 Tax=Rhodoligotrophos appendicifer TaxID=987056 RepID=UPI00118002A8|nr:methyltransferase domain-containing protein [Rhodoligotrophos appendicifer]
MKPTPDSGNAFPIVFDRRLVRARRSRALRQLKDVDFLTDAVIPELADRLALINRTFEMGMVMGAGAAHIARGLASAGRIERMIVADVAAANDADLVCDDEVLPLAPESLDCLVSGLAFHWINDLPGSLVQMRRALKADGLLLAALFGGETLFELRTSLLMAEADSPFGAAPRVSPFLDVRDAGALLQRAGFALPVVDSDRLTVRYPDPLALMRELRLLGATNAMVDRSRRPLTRSVLMKACEHYAAHFSDPDGKVRATFQVLYLTGWAPHESQQKPLRPGSATARLADALQTVEKNFPAR